MHASPAGDAFFMIDHGLSVLIHLHRPDRTSTDAGTHHLADGIERADLLAASPD